MKEGAGAVRVSVTPENLCDGEFHTVTGMCPCLKHTNESSEVLKFTRLHLSVSKQDGVVGLRVDSVSEQEVAPPASVLLTLETLHIGGK